MANPTVDLRPATLDLIFYAGDGPVIKLKCMDSEEVDAEPINLTGAVTAQIRISRLEPDPPLVSFTVDVTDAAAGEVTLTLTGAQTQDLVEDASATNGNFAGVWDIQWIATGSEPRTILQGSVKCVTDVTR